MEPQLEALIATALTAKDLDVLSCRFVDIIKVKFAFKRVQRSHELAFEIVEALEYPFAILFYFLVDSDRFKMLVLLRADSQRVQLACADLNLDRGLWPARLGRGPRFLRHFFLVFGLAFDHWVLLKFHSRQLFSEQAGPL